MIVGDIVRRTSLWKEWTAHNSWMSDPSAEELGIIIRLEPTLPRPLALIMWVNSGLRYSWVGGLEIVLPARVK